VVVVTIPEKQVSQLPEDLFEAVYDRVVVTDAGSYCPRHHDGRIGAVEEGVPKACGSLCSLVGRW
jgi:8-hydroxy-5-deazaflavin:NADPH oxidoreductase